MALFVSAVRTFGYALLLIPSTTTIVEAQCAGRADLGAFYETLLLPQAQHQFAARIEPIASVSCTSRELLALENWYVNVLLPGYLDLNAQLFSDCPPAGYAEEVVPSTEELESALSGQCFAAATRAVEILEKEQACERNWTAC